MSEIIDEHESIKKQSAAMLAIIFALLIEKNVITEQEYMDKQLWASRWASRWLNNESN